MDRELKDFLKYRNVPEEIQIKLEQEKMGPEEISTIETSVLIPYFSTLGDCIAVKEFCKNKIDKKNRKEGLVDIIKKKLSKKRKHKKATSCTSSSSDDDAKNIPSRSNNEKNTKKQIYVGWLCSVEDKKHIQIRLRQGGGTRKLTVDKKFKKSDILIASKKIFFKNGQSSKGQADNFEFDVWDFQHNPIDDSLTVQEMFDVTGLTRLRFYLVSTEVTTKGKRQFSEILNERSDEFLLPNTADNGLYEEPIDLLPYPLEPQVASYQSLNLETSNENFNAQQNSNFQVIHSDELNNLISAILNNSDKKKVNENENSPTVTDNFLEYDGPLEAPSLQAILLEFNKKIISDKINKFNVYRSDILNCCLRALRRATFNPFHTISVKFSDIEGSAEGAVDDGGPTREMFRLLMTHLRSSGLFTGSDKKNISLNNTLLHERLYFEAGRIIALSLIHGGPGPHFLSNSLYSVITVGPENTKFTLDDIEDEIKNKLLVFIEENNLNLLQDIVTSDSLFSTAGCTYIFKIEDKQQIFEDVLKFYGYHRVKEPIDQFMEGLQSCQILEVITKWPSIFKELMCEDKAPLTSDTLEALFEKAVEFSPLGSNKRNAENRTFSFFRDYLLDCEENANNDGVTLADLLIFATGADSIPPLGFSYVAGLTFIHSDNKLPTASTCSLELRLPTVHTRYEDFKNSMDFAIANSNTFGFA